MADSGRERGFHGTPLSLRCLQAKLEHKQLTQKLHYWPAVKLQLISVCRVQLSISTVFLIQQMMTATAELASSLHKSGHVTKEKWA